MWWQQLLLKVQWCHDTLTIIELMGMGVLLGVVITIAVLTWQSDRNWRKTLTTVQKQLHETQEQMSKIHKKIVQHHPEEKKE